MSASANSRVLFHCLHQFQYSRRLLFLNYSHLNSTSNSTSSESSILGDANFNANVIMVLIVILCALICSLGLNSIIRCILKCSNIVIPNNNNDPSNPTPARVANTGVKKKALKTFPTLAFSSESLKLPGLDTECAICLSEFDNGDRLRILPKCNHGFHVRCIDKWLSSHSSCPKCRHCLIHTSCQKKIAKSSSSVAPAETIVRIAPLEPEAMVRNYS